jgi:hypothetical protein
MLYKPCPENLARDAVEMFALRHPDLFPVAPFREEALKYSGWHDGLFGLPKPQTPLQAKKAQRYYNVWVADMRRRLATTCRLAADQIREQPARGGAAALQQSAAKDRPTEPSPAVQAVLAASQPPSDRQPGAGAPPPTGTVAPRRLIRGWKELCNKVGLKYADRRMLHRLSASQSGPIRTLGRGRPPEAWEDALITWWNDQEKRHAAVRERQESTAATLAGGFEYGRGSETVIPEVAMHLQRRRRPKISGTDAG